MKKDKIPRKEGHPHGYWEIYHNNGNLHYKGNYDNGNRVGLYEIYKYYGELYNKTYYIR